MEVLNKDDFKRKKIRKFTTSLKESHLQTIFLKESFFKITIGLAPERGH